MTFLFWLAAATLLITILAALNLVRGNRTIDALRDVAPDPGPAAGRGGNATKPFRKGYPSRP